MENDKLWYLKNLDIFEGISDEEIMEIAGQVRECMFQKDDLIYTPEDTFCCIYVVKRGEVRLFHSREGKRQVFDVLGPGSLFGGIQFSHEKSTHFAEAVAVTKVCIFTEENFQKILQKKPEIMMRFMRKMTDKIQGYEDRLKDRGESADETIVRELHRLRDTRGRSLFGIWKPSSVHVTHEELAELTGLNRVTVTRSLKRLKEDGRIQSTRGGIELL